MQYFESSEERLDRRFGPWLVAISVLLGIILCWYGDATFV
jgi:hypothetical protein